MVYLVIKELAEMANDVIMVTSSLTQDISNGKLDSVHRGNALRSLCRIVDPSMMQGIERFIKQCLVDKSKEVASAALVSSIHLFADNKEIVRRWSGEVGPRIAAGGGILQYHAFGLLYLMKTGDRMSIIKLITQLTNSNNPLATCLFIRCYAKLFEEPSASIPAIDLKPFIKYRSKYEMVALEAARAICNLPEEHSKGYILSALAVLQVFLSSTKAVVRFAAIRTLNQYATKHAHRVASCNGDIEPLVADSNRSIATLAITTLLKTGNEASIDRLLKQLTVFMFDLPDEFKVIVVEAIRALSIKFPSKYADMLSFLGTALREPGGLEYKKGIVECIVELMRSVPESKEQGLLQLCEFIEDCEFPKLGMDVLALLGEEGPFTPHPSTFITFIYNRLILENVGMRIAAVSALAQFAFHVGDLRGSIVDLLRRCGADEDDDVRDRAVFYVSLLEEQEQGDVEFVFARRGYSMHAMEERLMEYLEDERQMAVRAFAMSEVPVEDAVVTEEERKEEEKPNEPGMFANLSSIVAEKCIKSTGSIPLTEAETEYVVHCSKHLYAHHLVFQFTVRNTLENAMLQNVRVLMSCDRLPMQLVESQSVASLACGESKEVVLVFRIDRLRVPLGSIPAQLQFEVLEVDPVSGECEAGGGERDQYQLEDVDVQLSDFMEPVPLDVEREWAVLPAVRVETFTLGLGSLAKAVPLLSAQFGCAVVVGAELASASASTHAMAMTGVFFGEEPVVVRVRMALVSGAVTIEVTVKAKSERVCELVCESIN